jgi:preprotein translocase subunit YajC
MARHNVPWAELKLGDHVRIPGDGLEGRVVGVHPHNVEVEVAIDGEHVRRHYAYESVERAPTLDEASHYVDH